MKLKETLLEYLFLSYKINTLLEQNSSVFNQVKISKSSHKTNMLFLHRFAFHKDSFAMNKYPKEKKCIVQTCRDIFLQWKIRRKKAFRTWTPDRQVKKWFEFLYQQQLQIFNRHYLTSAPQTFLKPCIYGFICTKIEANAHLRGALNYILYFGKTLHQQDSYLWSGGN